MPLVDVDIAQGSPLKNYYQNGERSVERMLRAWHSSWADLERTPGLRG